MKELQYGLLSTKYTRVFHEEEVKFNAPHHFEVRSEQVVVGKIDFQEGPIKENGVNGVCNEDLIAMVIARLNGFQNSEYRSRDNACAITNLEEALLWLKKRTIERENRGVEGTSTV